MRMTVKGFADGCLVLLCLIIPCVNCSYFTKDSVIITSYIDVQPLVVFVCIGLYLNRSKTLP